MNVKCPLLCGYEGEFSTFKDGLCPKCKGIPKKNSEIRTKPKIRLLPRSRPLRITIIIFIVIFIFLTYPSIMSVLLQ